MKTLYLALLLALSGSLAIVGFASTRSLDERLLHLQAARQYPSYAAVLAGQPVEIQALMLDYAGDTILGTKAALTLIRHPVMAQEVFALYGDQPDFQAVLKEYGEHVVPPIHYFLSNDVLTLQLAQRAGSAARSATQAVRRLWGREPASEQAEAAGSADDAPVQAESSRVDRGWAAVQFIQREGHDFLGQFVLDSQGEVSWLQTERVLESLNSFFAGGVRALEARVRRDEPIGWADAGSAALDVAVGVGAFKLLRLGRTGTATTRSLTGTQRSAALGASLWRGSVVGLRLAKYGAPVVLAYMVVRHPSLLHSLFASLAQRIGMPVPLVQAAGWTLVLLPLILLARVLLWPLAAVLGWLARGLRWVAMVTRSGAPGRQQA